MVAFNVLESNPLARYSLATAMPILLDNPYEVGADRIVNAVAAFEAYGGACIVVDFGTATTFDVVSEAGDYLGGVICPGPRISADALFTRAARRGPLEPYPRSRDRQGPAGQGRLRLLATHGEKRMKNFPNVPTLKELGYDEKNPLKFTILINNGDTTLADIAARYAIAPEKILESNHLPANAIHAGLNLVIPVCLSTPTGTMTVTPMSNLGSPTPVD